jgi:hypothetical protein
MRPIPYKPGDHVQIKSPLGDKWDNAVIGWVKQEERQISFQYKSGVAEGFYNAEQNYDKLTLKLGWGKVTTKKTEASGNYLGHGRYHEED